MRRPLLPVIALALLLLGGCASFPYMPLADKTPAVDQAKPLYLMSVVLRNDHKPRWQPRVLNVILTREDGRAKPESFVLRMDPKGIVKPVEEGGKTTYLVRFTGEQVPVGLRGFFAQGSAFPIHGYYFVPMHAEVPRFDRGVHYLGSAEAVVRERRDGEFRAGDVIPLIDQAIAGASTGTFDIVISDAYEHDVALFRRAFPVLEAVEIERAVLAPWDRAKAQRYWDEN